MPARLRAIEPGHSALQRGLRTRVRGPRWIVASGRVAGECGAREDTRREVGHTGRDARRWDNEWERPNIRSQPTPECLMVILEEEAPRRRPSKTQPAEADRIRRCLDPRVRDGTRPIIAEMMTLRRQVSRRGQGQSETPPGRPVPFWTRHLCLASGTVDNGRRLLHALVEFQKLDIDMASSISEASRSGGQAPLYDKLRPRPNGSHAEVHSNQRARLYGAMVDAIAAHGYEATTVRELAGLAGVSTRTLYERVTSKQACLLAAHDILVRRTARRVLAAQKVAPDRQQRLRIAFETFTHEVAEDPKAGWLTLVEAPVCGTAALQRTRRASGLFESMVAHSFRHAPDGAPAQALVTRGIVAGVSHVARGALLDGRGAELPASAGDLLGWARCCASPVACTPATLGLPLADHDAQVLNSDAIEDARRNDRDHIVRAAAELAVADGRPRPSVAEIAARACVARRTFESEFGGVEDCLLAALEDAHAQMLTLVSEAGSPDGADWARGVGRGVDAVMRLLARDRVLARIAFVEVFALGLAGLESRERLLSGWAGLLRERAPPVYRSNPVVAQASVGALWEVVRDRVARGEAGRSSRVVGQLSFMILAPVLGVDAALEGISQEA